MKLERRQATVIAAEPAATARLLDQDLLDASPPRSYCMRPAALAVETAVRAHDRELSFAVVLA
jgi:hypothetical protein